jgi:hypothetical protein
MTVDNSTANVAIAYAYAQTQFVANKVFPVVNVPKRKDKYLMYRGGEFVTSDDEYYAEQYSRNMTVVEGDSRAPLQPIIEATMTCTEHILVDNEIAVATMSMDPRNYISDHVIKLGPLQAWTNNNSEPYYRSFPILHDIARAKHYVEASTGKRANRLLLNYEAQSILSQNWEYNERIKYSSKDTELTSGLDPVIFGLEVVDASVMMTVTPETSGVTPAVKYIWSTPNGDPAALVYYEPSEAELRNGQKCLSLGKTFEAPDDTYGAYGFVTKRWREEWIASERIVIRVTRDWQFTASAGVLITGIKA